MRSDFVLVVISIAMAAIIFWRLGNLKPSMLTIRVKGSLEAKVNALRTKP